MLRYLLLLSLFAVPAYACRMTKPLDDKIKSEADLVFVGKAVDYVPSKFTKGKGLTPARIRFAVEKTIRGEKKTEVEALWVNGTFGESKSLREFRERYGELLEVGLTTKRSKLAEYYAKGSELPWVTQHPCSDPYLIKR
jgi:hypothetical protein